jgi:hypothetical protein
MIDPVLKKFGFSEARKSIKNLNNAYSTTKTASKIMSTDRKKNY